MEIKAEPQNDAPKSDNELSRLITLLESITNKVKKTEDKKIAYVAKSAAVLFNDNNKGYEEKKGTGKFLPGQEYLLGTTLKYTKTLTDELAERDFVLDKLLDGFTLCSDESFFIYSQFISQIFTMNFSFLVNLEFRNLLDDIREYILTHQVNQIIQFMPQLIESFQKTAVAIKQIIEKCDSLPNFHVIENLNQVLKECVEGLSDIQKKLQTPAMGKNVIFLKTLSMFCRILTHVNEQAIDVMMELNKKSQTQMLQLKEIEIAHNTREPNNSPSVERKKITKKAKNSFDVVYEGFAEISEIYKGSEDANLKIQNVIKNTHSIKETDSAELKAHVNMTYNLYVLVNLKTNKKLNLNFSDPSIKQYLPNTLSKDDFQVGTSPKKNNSEAKKSKSNSLFKTISSPVNILILKEDQYLVTSLNEKSSSFFKGLFHKSNHQHQQQLALCKKSKPIILFTNDDQSQIFVAVIETECLAIACDQTLHFMKLENKTITKSIKLSAKVTSICKVTDNPKLLIGLADGNIECIELFSDKRSTLKLDSKIISLLNYVNDNKLLVVVNDEKIMLMGIEGSNILCESPLLNAGVITATCMDGSKAYCCFDTGEAAVWMTDINKFSLISPKLHNQKITSIGIYGPLLCTASLDKTVKIWNKTNYECVNTISYEDPIIKFIIEKDDFIVLTTKGKIYREQLKELLPKTEMKKSASTSSLT